MTGNQIKGKGFRGALRYNLEKVNKGVAEILDHSFASTSERIIMKEIQMVKVLRPNLQKYFYHTSINFPPGEDIPNDKMKQIGLDYLESNGFTQHQFIMFRHYDADHPHLHILVNRIGYDGSVVSDSNDFSRSEKILRELEKKYKLTQVMPSKKAKVRAITKDELEMVKRTSAPSHKMKLQSIIRKILQDKPELTTEEFINALRSNRINVLFNQASTGYVSGISYGYDRVIIKGAKLGNDFMWSSIKNKIDYNQVRDREVIQQINAKVKSGNSDTRLIQSAQQDNGRLYNIPESSKSLIATTPIDDRFLEHLIRADPQPEIDIERALKLKRKKRRRKRLGP
jgi:hypothetical protein